MLEFEGVLDLHPTDRVELLVADASLARALFEGIPVARLLGSLMMGWKTRTSLPIGGLVGTNRMRHR